MAKKKLIAEAVEGDRGTPGDYYRLCTATVYHLDSGRWELNTRITGGSNQGHLEEHNRDERTYRADSIYELLFIGIAESRSDDKMADDELYQAIRSAIFEAEDSEVGQ